MEVKRLGPEGFCIKYPNVKTREDFEITLFANLIPIIVIGNIAFPLIVYFKSKALWALIAMPMINIYFLYLWKKNIKRIASEIKSEE